MENKVPSTPNRALRKAFASRQYSIFRRSCKNVHTFRAHLESVEKFFLSLCSAPNVASSYRISFLGSSATPRFFPVTSACQASVRTLTKPTTRRLPGMLLERALPSLGLAMGVIDPFVATCYKCPFYAGMLE